MTIHLDTAPWSQPDRLREDQTHRQARRTDVLIVGNFLSGSGLTRSVCEDLAEKFCARGWRVVSTSRIKHRVLRPLDMLYTVWRQRKRYAVAQVDVFSGPAFLWAEAVCFLLRVLRKPFVLTLHGGNLPQFALRWPRRVQRLLDSASAVTVPSGHLLEAMRRYRADLFLVPNAVDLATYRFVTREKAHPRLVWVRAFHRIYNPTLALRTLPLLHAQFPQIRLTMVGPDTSDGSLQQTMEVGRFLGVAPLTRFTGGVPKSEVSAHLGAADVFLNTTDVDNTPVSVIEAMACGLCVVSTRVGGIPYLLEHERDALLVAPNDPVAMAGAVRRLLTEPGLAAWLSGNARRKAESYDWSTILPRWESLLGSVIHRDAPRD